MPGMSNGTGVAGKILDYVRDASAALEDRINLSPTIADKDIVLARLQLVR